MAPRWDFCVELELGKKVVEAGPERGIGPVIGAGSGTGFVVGSDGYVYEGRGWHWVGAHTRGHNSRGFGVAIVGNYTAGLPTEAALRTLHDLLPRCAVRAGLLKPDYALLGHRQLVHTDCPGDALFNLLRTWPRFATSVKPRTARRASRRSKRKPSPVILPVTDLQ